MKKAAPWVVLAVVLAFVAWKLHGSHFDWAGCWRSFRTADWRLLAAAVLVIYSNSVIRAIRWAVFLGEPRRWRELVGSQYIGFAGLAIFGRIGELIRPLLVARRTGRTFASQVAVVTVERVFDLGAFGAIFAGNLLFSPGLRALPYIAVAGRVIGGLTVAIAVFVALVWFAGDWVARVAGRMAGALSAKAGASVSEKILSFRDGLRVISTVGDFLAVTGLSIFLWVTVVLGYVLVLKAFPSPVHQLTVGKTILTLGFSVAGSALPVPSGSGAWAGISFALREIFGIPAELAYSSALMVWIISTLAVIPVGLIFARIEGVKLGSTLAVSEEKEALEQA